MGMYSLNFYSPESSVNIWFSDGFWRNESLVHIFWYSVYFGGYYDIKHCIVKNFSILGGT